ncbi:MAG: hypothetical protein ABIK07_06285, partial [Planctomycetota bacterium]
MPYEILDKMPDGLQRVELQPGLDTSGTRENTVTVRATLAKPVNELIVIPVTLENSKTQNSYLLLSANQDFRLTDHNQRQTVLPENVPSWIQTRCNAASHLDCDRLFTSALLPWMLKTASPATGELSDERIPFMESEIILGDQGTINGLTHIKLFNQTSRELKLEWPEKTKLMAVLVDGENDATVKQDKGTITIPLNGGPGLMDVTLYWESYQVDHQYFLEKARLQTPRPSNFVFDRNLVKIIASDRNRTFLSKDVTPFMYLADRLEAQLKIADIQLELGAKTNVPQSTWDTVEQEFSQLESILSDPGNDRQGISEKLNRFETLKERVFELKKYVKPDTSTDQQAQLLVNQFQQKLGPVPIQKVRYYSSSENADPEQHPLFAWIIPSEYLNIALACICLMILLPILNRCVQTRSADWLSMHPTIGLLVLGLIWILFLSPQYIGVVIICVSALVALRTNQTISLSSNTSVTNFPANQSVKE